MKIEKICPFKKNDSSIAIQLLQQITFSSNIFEPWEQQLYQFPLYSPEDLKRPATLNVWFHFSICIHVCTVCHFMFSDPLDRWPEWLFANIWQSHAAGGLTASIKSNIRDSMRWKLKHVHQFKLHMKLCQMTNWYQKTCLGSQVWITKTSTPHWNIASLSACLVSYVRMHAPVPIWVYVCLPMQIQIYAPCMRIGVCVCVCVYCICTFVWCMQW